jgi:hypothetical protein
LWQRTKALLDKTASPLCLVSVPFVASSLLGLFNGALNVYNREIRSGIAGPSGNNWAENEAKQETKAAFAFSWE